MKRERDLVGRFREHAAHSDIIREFTLWKDTPGWSHTSVSAAHSKARAWIDGTRYMRSHSMSARTEPSRPVSQDIGIIGSGPDFPSGPSTPMRAIGVAWLRLVVT